MPDLNPFNLDAAALAEIDRQIAAKLRRPHPREIIAVLNAAPANESMTIASAVKLRAIYRDCSAAEAQEELAEWFRIDPCGALWHAH